MEIILHDLRWFADRTLKWVHDSLVVLGIVSLYLIISGMLPQDISKEIKDKYTEQVAANKAKQPS